MSKYDELVYLYSPTHKRECCDFLNFIADSIARHYECSRDKIVFLNDSGVSENCTEAVIKEIRKGFVYTTIAIHVPDEETMGSHIHTDMCLQKIQNHFLVRIDQLSYTYLLLEEHNIEMSNFCDALFNLFTDR